MAYDAKTKAKARKMYEMGESTRSIGEALDLDFKTVMAWADAGEWEKGVLVSKVEQKEEETLLAQAEKVGLTKAKVLGKIAEFLEAEKPIKVDVPSDEDRKRAIEEGDESGGVFVQTVPDYKTQTEGAKMAIDVLGMKKQAVEIDVGAGLSQLFELLKGAA